MHMSQDRSLAIIPSNVMRKMELETVAQFDKGLAKTGICIINNKSNHGKFFTVGLHLLGVEEFIFEGEPEITNKIASVIDLILEQDLLPSEVTEVIEDLGLSWYEVDSQEFLYGIGMDYRFWLESKSLATPRFLEVYVRDFEN